MVASKTNLPSGPSTIVSLSFYSYLYTGWLRLALYSDNGSGTAPVNLLCQSPAYHVNGTGWVTLDVPDTPVTAGNYWIDISAESAVSLLYTPGSSGDSVVETLGYGYFPSTFTVYAPQTNNWDYSTHANYCNALVGTYTATPTSTPTFTSTPTITYTPSPVPTDTPLCGSPSYFGSSGPGAVTIGLAPGWTVASKMNLSSGPSTIVTLSFYTYLYTGWLRLGLYSDNGSGTAPVNLLCQSSPSYVNGTGWATLDVPDTPVTAGNYWIAICPESAVSLLYAPGSSGDSVVDTIGYGPLPSTFTVYVPQTNNWDYPTHANYCP
jgi:hypothetical protein